MYTILSTNVPSAINVGITVEDPILNKTWTNTITNKILDQAINYVEVGLSDVIANEDVPLVQQQGNFWTFLSFLFTATDVTEITGIYETPSQMLAFMSYIAPAFNLFAQKNAEVKKSFEQQFLDTSAIAGLGLTRNLFVEFHS